MHKFSRNAVKPFDFPAKVQSILYEALMVKHAYFLLESSCFDKAQIHLVSSIKHREEGRETAGGEEGRLENRS